MSDPITLDYEVEVNGEKITSLTMRRPKVRDDLAMDSHKGTAAEKEIFLFANLCDVSMDVICDLDQGADYTKLQEKYSGFFGSKK
ncbi:phage tail assembly protein [Emcibacter sp.]|uniref:phage tail assembly protein n=1 Tax=Emcibacter sp. TaxID=1979954 RepID=UPI002AA5F0D9|nr:phage tail assembly protein [Emcibacter sp.]